MSRSCGAGTICSWSLLAISLLPPHNPPLCPWEAHCTHTPYIHHIQYVATRNRLQLHIFQSRKSCYTASLAGFLLLSNCCQLAQPKHHHCHMVWLLEKEKNIDNVFELHFLSFFFFFWCSRRKIRKYQGTVKYLLHPNTQILSKYIG